jgi:hypothetical protein
MNDDARLERLFGDGLHDIAPLRAPDRLRTQIKAETSGKRPRRRWLALIKEPPMRTNSRLAVGSPTARVAAIVVATLLLATMVAGASFAGAQVFGADGPMVVDPSGSGDYTTITEAVAAAEDGDEILVRPGTYTEAFVIDKDIRLTGDGPVEDIVVEAPEDGPQYGGRPRDFYALLLQDAGATTISGLTFRGEPSLVIVSGGSPTIQDSVFDNVGWAFGTRGTGNDGSSIHVNDGSTATIVRNSLIGGGPVGVFGESVPLIDENSLTGGPHIYLASQGEGTVVKANTIDGTLRWGIGVFDRDPVTIEGNMITNPGQNGINLSSGSGTIRDNVISGAQLTAIATGNWDATVVGNKLTDNQIAISYSAAEGLIEGNVVEGGVVGIVVVGRSPLVKDNVVRGVEGRGIVVGVNTSPTLSGNTSCENGTNLFIGEGAEPDIDESNEICEDAPAE